MVPLRENDDDASSSKTAGLFCECMQTLEGCAPKVKSVSFERPQTLVLWRVDIPPRGLVYTGNNVEEMLRITPSRHHLPKTMVFTRVGDRVAAGIRHFGGRGGPPKEEHLLKAMASYAANHLPSHVCNSIPQSKTDPTSRITLTTLPEAMSCFVLHPPLHRTVTRIGVSSPWSDDAIDHRYSEKQEAGNGFRLRDWAAMHVDEEGTHQARLASHVLEYSRLYITLLPWFNQTQQMRWVKVTSTQPPTNMLLQGNTLRQAVEGRYFHDPRTLPLLNRQNNGLHVERHDCEIYSPSPGSSAIAYTATPVSASSPSPGSDNKNNIDVILFEDCMRDIKTSPAAARESTPPENKGRKEGIITTGSMGGSASRRSNNKHERCPW